MVSCFSHFVIVLLVAIGVFLCLLRHLAVITCAIHVCRVCDGRNKQRKGNKEGKDSFFHVIKHRWQRLTYN